jgi:hypothetical protein
LSDRLKGQSRISTGTSDSKLFSEQFDVDSSKLHVVLRDATEPNFDNDRDGDPDIGVKLTG